MLRINHFIYQSEDGLVCSDNQKNNERLVGSIPPLYPENLGSDAFKRSMNIRFAYIAGAMARGIASEELVIEVAKHGGLGFFGSAGLSISRIRQAIDKINFYLEGEFPFGMNLIHNLKEQQAEMDQVALFIEKKVHYVEAAAFTSVTPAIIWFAFKSIHRDENGFVIRPNHIFAKISHDYVAQAFLSPPDPEILEMLLSQGLLTPEEVSIARNTPIAECITVESDSGGHTDNRPSTALFPVIKLISQRIIEEHGYTQSPFIGLAGGLGSPEALSSAYDMGADYVVIGSVHQSCVESGTSLEVKKMLGAAGLSDYAMTPSADMFEEGIKVQVLKKGTMMPMFGNRLIEIYRTYQSLEELPDHILQELEKKILKKTTDDIWKDTKAYFEVHEPSQLILAENDAHHKMALIFRWYLGKSNQWPIDGNKERRTDYQIWCGPSMGAFNEWAKGTFLESLENRAVGQVMLNLLEATACHKRIQIMKSLGIEPEKEYKYTPQEIILK